MNAEVQFEIEGKTLKYSITEDGTVYEIRPTGWRKVTSELVKRVIFMRLSEMQGGFDA